MESVGVASPHDAGDWLVDVFRNKLTRMNWLIGCMALSHKPLQTQPHAVLESQPWLLGMNVYFLTGGSTATARLLGVPDGSNFVYLDCITLYSWDVSITLHSSV